MKDFSSHHWTGAESGGRTGFMAAWRNHSRIQRGDMSPFMLRILLAKPMHGYEIIRTLEEKSHGFWRPSPGSVYPTLQLLEEQELVTCSEEGGKKVYALTEKGKEQAQDIPHSSPWEHKLRGPGDFREIGAAIPDIMRSLKEISSEGSEEDMEAAKKIIFEAKDQIVRLAKNISN